MSMKLTRSIIVPEYGNGLVKAYRPDPTTGLPVEDVPFGLDLNAIVGGLFPGLQAAPNACALHGDDLFVTNSSVDSQAVFKFPGYLRDPAASIAKAFVITLVGNDYVGMAFDVAGNLYVAEGSYDDNRLVRYVGADTPYPGATAAVSNNYVLMTGLGNAGLKSYFGDLVVDGQGNLWGADYKNDRVVVIPNAATAVADTPEFRVLGNLIGSIPVANTDPALHGPATQVFAGPEGIDFDDNGDLWVSNNNDAGEQLLTSVVRITSALQATVLSQPRGSTYTPPGTALNSTLFVYQVPNGPVARPQLGGLQIDRTAHRAYVNEEKSHSGRAYDLATMAAVSAAPGANDLAITSTAAGNGGLALVRTSAPILFIRDDSTDTGLAPTTGSTPWESPDVWPRQGADGSESGPGSFAEAVAPLMPAFVYVRVSNAGLGPSGGTEEVRVYWGRASTGLSVPPPWDGSIPGAGGLVGRATIPAVAPGGDQLVKVDWAKTPDSNTGATPHDGHFCLLAEVTSPTAADLAGATPGDLIGSVQRLPHLAWRNIHITVAGEPQIHPINRPLGVIRMANHTPHDVVAALTLELIDRAGHVDPKSTARFVLDLTSDLLGRVHSVTGELEPLGGGQFEALHAGIGHLPLKPGEIINIGLSVAVDPALHDFAVRAVQHRVADGRRTVVGGQTFVVGRVRRLNA